jgi:hypothetical protein
VGEALEKSLWVWAKNTGSETNRIQGFELQLGTMAGTGNASRPLCGCGDCPKSLSIWLPEKQAQGRTSIPGVCIL